MKKHLFVGMLLGTTLLWTSVHAAPGTLLRDESLRKQPSASAAVSARLGRGTAVDIVTRRGGWVQVRTARSQGWVRLLSVRAGNGSSRGAGLGDVVGVATRRANPSRVVSVAGVRGLDETDLQKAEFSAEELARLEDYVVTPSEAKVYAGKGGLAAIRVPSLPRPQPRSQPSNSRSPDDAWPEN